jgi:hypothetical protein
LQYTLILIFEPVFGRCAVVVVVVDAGKILLLQVMVQLLLQLQHKLDKLRRQLLPDLPEQLFQRSKQHRTPFLPVLPARPPLILKIMVETVEHQKMMDLKTATMMSCAQKQ